MLLPLQAGGAWLIFLGCQACRNRTGLPGEGSIPYSGSLFRHGQGPWEGLGSGGHAGAGFRSSTHISSGASGKPGYLYLK
jgi:hypothetical protein